MATTPKNATTNTVTTPSQPAFDQAAYLKQQQDAVNSMYDQIQQQQIAALQAQKQKAVNDVNYQKEKVAPQYQGMRNQADVVNLQNSKRLQELMASRGLGSSGENVTATVNMNNARQKSLNDLNLQEQQTINDFDHQITQINDPSDIQALIAQLGQQRAQSLYDAGIRADDRGYQVGRDSVADNQWLQQFNYNKNIDDRNYNYQVGRDKVSDKQWNDQFNYQKGRDKVADSQWQKQFDAQNSHWQKEFDQNAKQFGMNYALQKMQFDLDKKVRLGQLSIDQAQLALAQARAKSGSSGGGGASRGSSASAAASASPSLASAYQQYQKEKSSASKSALDKYYQAQEKDIIKKTKAPYKNTVLKPVAPAQNKNLTDFEKLRLMGLM